MITRKRLSFKEYNRIQECKMPPMIVLRTRWYERYVNWAKHRLRRCHAFCPWCCQEFAEETAEKERQAKQSAPGANTYTLLSSAFFRLGPFYWRTFGIVVMRRPAWRPSTYRCDAWNSWEFLWLRVYWGWKK